MYTFFIYTIFNLINVNAPISAQLVAFLDRMAISTSVFWPVQLSYLRTKFDFRSVHGIMNTSGLLQSK